MNREKLLMIHQAVSGLIAVLTELEGLEGCRGIAQGGIGVRTFPIVEDSTRIRFTITNEEVIVYGFT